MILTFVTFVTPQENLGRPCGRHWGLGVNLERKMASIAWGMEMTPWGLAKKTARNLV